MVIDQPEDTNPDILPDDLFIDSQEDEVEPDNLSDYLDINFDVEYS